MDVAADQVFEEVVAVEPAPTLSQLGDPWPDLVAGGANGDGPGCREIGVRDQGMARERLVGLLVGRAPAEIPGLRNET